MPDPYATITDVAPAVVERVAEAMEVSAADPQQLAMVEAYVDDLALGDGARVLEVGCGTGAISRAIGARSEVGSVHGVDPSPILIERARELAGERAGLTFAVGDGRALDVTDAAFDAAVVHRVLSHVPDPERVVAEAARALRPGGRLALFDGDYATVTLAVGEDDPLQVCVDAFRGAYVTDPWVVRRFPALARGAGLVPGRVRSYGFVQTSDPDYMLSIADRGAETLAAAGTIGEDLAEALRQEARRRVAEHAFYGHAAYASLVAGKPA